MAAVELDDVQASDWRQRGLMNVFPDVATMIVRDKPDAAIVCSPNHTHAETARALLDAGVHVLVEKPLALSAREAWELVESARAKGLVLQTASKFGVMESLQRAAGLVREGAIGAPARLENVFSGVFDVRGDWRAQPSVSGGGVWMDNGPHALDVLTALAGVPRRIRVREQGYEQGTPVEDRIVVELEFEGGVTGEIRLTWNEQFQAPIARVVGEKGAIDVGWAELRLSDAASAQVCGGGYDKQGCFCAVHDRFLDAIASGGGGADSHGATTLATIEAGYRSAARGGSWQQVEVRG